MSKRTFWLIVLIGSLALNIGFLAAFAMNYLAKPRPLDIRVCPMTTDYNHFYTYLGLNDDQLARIKPLAHDFHSRIETLSSRILDRRNKFIIEIEKDVIDKEAIESLHKDIAQAQSELQELVVEHFLDMKAVMNEEQKRKFFAAMEKNFVNQDFSLGAK